MTSKSKMRIVLEMLRYNQVEEELCSPNYVADFASSRGIKLTSEDIVKVSDTYHSCKEYISKYNKHVAELNQNK